jgi:TetR/AcrR family transcriptional regulator
MNPETLTDTEKKIIQAATQIFLEQGKAGARMEEIAKAAGLNQALLHYYFRSKEKLYQHVFKKKIQEFFYTLFNSFTPADKPEVFIKNFIFNYIDLIQKNPQVVRFILWEIGKSSDLIKKTFAELVYSRGENIPDILIKRIETTIAENKIRQVDPQHLMFSLIGMSLIVFIAKPIIETVFENVDVTDLKFIEARKTAIFDLVWNGLKIS